MKSPGQLDTPVRFLKGIGPKRAEVLAGHGIVTVRDVRQVAAGYPSFRDVHVIHRYTENLTVTAAMTADPMTIAPDASLVEAAKVLETYRISSMPVVDDRRLVGMLTVTDVLRVFVEQNEECAA